MIYSENGIKKLLGVKVHNAVEGSIKTETQGMLRFAKCKWCDEVIESFFNDDEDRMGWSAWTSKNGRCVGSKNSNRSVTI